MPPVQARAEIDDLLAWRPRPLTAELIVEARGVEDRYGLSYWDALVVVVAKAAGCTHLLSEDLQDAQDLDRALTTPA